MHPFGFFTQPYPVNAQFVSSPGLHPDFEVDYLGGSHANFGLNFSRGAAQIVAQYYNLIRLGRQGYTEIMLALTETAPGSGYFEVQIADESGVLQKVTGDVDLVDVRHANGQALTYIYSRESEAEATIAVRSSALSLSCGASHAIR